MITVALAAASNGNNEIVAAAAGYKYRVIAFLLAFSGSVNAKWRSASTDKTGFVYGAAGVVAPSPALPPLPAKQPAQFETEPGEALNLFLSAGGTTVGGYVVYDKVPAGS